MGSGWTTGPCRDHAAKDVWRKSGGAARYESGGPAAFFRRVLRNGSGPLLDRELEAADLGGEGGYAGHDQDCFLVGGQVQVQAALVVLVQSDGLNGGLGALGDDLDDELLRQYVVHADKALAGPAASIFLKISQVVELGDGDVVHHEAGPIDRRVGDVLKTQLHLLAGKLRQVDGFVEPLAVVAAAGVAGVAPAKVVAGGVVVGARGGLDDLPGVAAVGGGLQVSEVVVLLQLIPGIVLERGLGQAGQVELARHAGVAGVVAVSPEGIASADGVGWQHLHLLRAGEGDVELASAVDLVIGGAELMHVGRGIDRAGGIGVSGGIDLGRLQVVVVGIAAVGHAGIAQVVGDGPVREHVHAGQLLAGGLVFNAQGGQSGVDRVHAIVGVGHERLGGAVAKTIQEIRHKQEAGAIVRANAGVGGGVL